LRYQATLRRPRGRPGGSEEYVSLQTPLDRILHWSRQYLCTNSPTCRAKSYTNPSIFQRDNIDYFNERGIPRAQNDPRPNGRLERQALEFGKTAMKSLTM